MFRLALLATVLLSSLGCSPCFAKQPDCGAGQTVEATADSSAVLVARRGRTTFRDVVKQAIRQSDDLTRIEKLKLRLTMAISPAAREAVEDFLIEAAAEEGVQVADADAQIDLDQLERLLQILIEYLPAIIEIISELFGSAGQSIPIPIQTISIHAPPVPLQLAA